MLKRCICIFLCACFFVGFATPAYADDNAEEETPYQSEYAYLNKDCVLGSDELIEANPKRASEDYRTWAQADSRWGSIRMGNSGGTIAQYGCTVSSVTKLIIQCGLRDSGTFTIATLANWLNSNNGYTADGGLYWDKPSSCVTGFKNHGDIVAYGSYDSAGNNDQIIGWIRSGYHMTINVNNGGHWVAVDEARSLSTGQVYIMDSLSGKQNADITLVSRYSTFNMIHAYTGGTTPTGDLAATISGLNMPDSIATGGNPELSGTIAGNFNFTWVWVGIDHLGQYDHVSQAQTNPMTSTYDLSTLLNQLDFAGLSAGSYTLKVEATGGDKYWTLYAKNFTVKDGNMKVTGVSVPSTIYVGENVSITGTVSAAFPITWVWAGVDTVRTYDHIIQAQANPMSTSYSLNGLLSQLDLSSLPIGNYTYKIEGICGYKYFVLYAQNFSVVAKPATMTVTFNPNGGSVSPTSKTVTYGSAYGTLPTPTRTYYNFDGWYTSASGGSKVTASTTVTATTNHSLYAHWTHVCANGHNYNYAVVTAPTTSATGTLIGTCSRCGATTTITLPKLTTADYNYSVIQAATCTANGTGRYTWKTTTYGTFSFDVTIPKTGHSYTETVNPPTCTAQGYTTYTCSVCGDSYKDSYTNAVGHAWDTGVITKPATETETGIKTFTCTRCGETKTEVIPKLDGTVNPFVDVIEGKYYYGPVLWAYYHEPRITSGLDATHFGPDATCTRAQIMTFLWHAKNDPTPMNLTNPFTDVEPGKYYEKPILWAYYNTPRVTGGTTTSTFGINDPCLREQVVAFLWKAAGAPEPETINNPFTDVIEGKYYFKAVLWAVENGITKGVSATTFGVGQTCTRAQIVTFLYAAYGKNQ